MKNIFQFIYLLLFISFQSIGQIYTPVNENRVLVGAFPFQNFTYDARSAALGEAGIAISPDANSGWMNPAKLVFLNATKDNSQKVNSFGISINYTPYYRNLIQGMNLFGFKCFQSQKHSCFRTDC